MLTIPKQGGYLGDVYQGWYWPTSTWWQHTATESTANVPALWWLGVEGCSDRHIKPLGNIRTQLHWCIRFVDQLMMVRVLVKQDREIGRDRYDAWCRFMTSWDSKQQTRMNWANRYCHVPLVINQKWQSIEVTDTSDWLKHWLQCSWGHPSFGGSSNQLIM